MTLNRNGLGGNCIWPFMRNIKLLPITSLKSQSVMPAHWAYCSIRLILFDTFMADGAYDGDPVYAHIIEPQPNANIIIPPSKNAVANAS